MKLFFENLNSDIYLSHFINIYICKMIVSRVRDNKSYKFKMRKIRSKLRYLEHLSFDYVRIN